MEAAVSQQAYTSMMKFTIDGRPFVKDIHDLFAALIVQTPLDTHRYLFRNYYSTFSSEDAIHALGDLRFSHTVRMPDPNDPSRLQRTTTTTTFNMAREMAKTLCQQFQNCRLMENAVDHQNRTFREKGIWHLTPKGLCVLQDFCVRTEVNLSNLRKHFSQMEAISLVRLERNVDDDQLILSRACISVVFRVMMASLPREGDLPTSGGNASSVAAVAITNTPPSSTTSSVSSRSSSSTPSFSAPFAMSSNTSNSESRVHLLSNTLLTLSTKRSGQTKNPKSMRTIFSSQMCCDWLADYSTVSCKEEAETVISEFLKYGWIEYQDSKYASYGPLKTSKTVMFVVTEKGKKVVTEQTKTNTPSSTNSLTTSSKQTGTTHTSSSSSSNNNNNNNNNTNGGSSNISKNSLLEEDDNQTTTLKEMLSQDPESLLITTTHSVEDEVVSLDIANPSSITLTTATTTTSAAATNSKQLGDRLDTLSLSSSSSLSQNDQKESNSAKLKFILENPKLRSPFKDFLRANFCEENLDFWIDYNTLTRKCRNQSPALPSQNQKDLLEDAYDIWSTYLAPGSSSELNVEHSLCQEMQRLVQSVITVIPAYSGQTNPTIVITASSVSQSLRMMLKLFDRVNEHICRLMASDSVPKFVKTERYRKITEAIERSERKKMRELTSELVNMKNNNDDNDDEREVDDDDDDEAEVAAVEKLKKESKTIAAVKTTVV